LASCSGDKTIKIWGRADKGGLECKVLFNLICQTPKATLDGQHTRTIRSVAWSPDGNLLASAGFDSHLCLWLKKPNEFECVAVMDGHENEVSDRLFV
jgi:cytosolic iron-sulfur protein assembly protein CIAO1